MKAEKKPGRLRQALSLILFVSLLLGLVFSLVRMFQAPVTSENEEERLKSDYLLMVVECAAGMIVMMLPSFLEKRFRLQIPGVMWILYDLFLYCAIFLGEVRDFYYRVPHWDSVLHLFSGLMLGTLGFILAEYLNRTATGHIQMSPFFVCLFAFCFALTVGTLWEIYEYSIDGIMGLNMQKYAWADHSVKIGRDALTDTMKDIIIDALAALASAVVGYFSLKKKSAEE